MANKQAIEQVTSGTYQRETSLTADLQTTAGTEQELTTLASVVLADTKDELFSWVRHNVLVVPLGTAINIVELYWIKCLSTDALQNLDDNTVVELLQKEGKLFTRQYVAWNEASQPRKVMVEFFNVKLKLGEELRLVVRACTSCANSTWVYEDLEYRKVGA